MTARQSRRKVERVTQAELARRLGVTGPSVLKAVKTGRLSPPGDDGLFDFVTAQAEWVSNRKRPTNDGTGSVSKVGEGRDWDDLLKREKYRAARLKREELERKLVRRSSVEAESANVMATVRSHFEGVGRVLQDALAACVEPRACGDMVQDKIREVLTRLADSAPPEEDDDDE